ncbi:MAG: hypothetical protein DMG13_11240, partial [Acidobacteria bacterium]
MAADQRLEFGPGAIVMGARSSGVRLCRDELLFELIPFVLSRLQLQFEPAVRLLLVGKLLLIFDSGFDGLRRPILLLQFGDNLPVLFEILLPHNARFRRLARCCLQFLHL